MPKIGNHHKNRSWYVVLIFFLLALALLQVVRFFPALFYKIFFPADYLILHGLAEIFSVIVSLQIFILSWSTYKETQNSRSFLIGISFLGVAILDTLHIFAFPGMPKLFAESSPQKAIYYWLGARFWVVGSLLAAYFLPHEKNRRLLSRPLCLGGVLTAAALLAVFETYFGSYVPLLFIAGVGVTPLKIVLEWVIMAVALVAFLLYGREYLRRQEKTLLYLMVGLAITIVSEMCFTFYLSVYDTYNFLGHVYKVISYGFFFHALFIGEIKQPYLALAQAHRELGASEYRYRTLWDNIPIGIVATTPEGKLMDGNPATWKMFGYDSKEEALDLPVITHYCDPEDRKRFLEQLISQGNIENFEVQFKRKDGSLFWGRVTSTLQTLGNGTVQIINAVEDVTERKRAEEQLRKLSRVVEQSPAIITITDIKGNIEFINPRFTEVTGYTVEKLRGQNLRILKSGKTTPEEYKGLWDTIIAGGVWRGEFYNKKKDGEYYWESAAISSIKTPQGAISHFFKVAQDITERKHLEEQLLQSQKMEAVGTLAGGVAHDFNNLLTAIMGNLELAKVKLKEGQAAEFHLEEIESITQRAAQLTGQLLAFSRRQIIRPQPLNLNDTISGMSKMLGRLIGEHITLELHLEERLTPVMADPGQVEQVIMNLCVNAHDAMPAGGKLILETQNTSLEEKYIEGHPWVKSGDYVMLAVTDSGCGMEEAVRRRIFEPFFTTKEVGKGTGLGLSMVYGIVKQHLGYINIYSEPGLGTTFKIYLPRSEEKVAAEAVQEKPQEIKRGEETILLAEDEDSLRETIQQILEMYGYTVLAARDGQEAVELYDQEKERIDLAILDAVMPKMGGKQVAEWIYKVKPSQKILFSSGYSASGIHESFIVPGEVHFIQKPYRAQELARKVRQVLDE